MKLLQVIVLLFCIIYDADAGHQVSLLQYTAENGLSDNQVTCVTRDKQGFIWVGTKDGLNRFDGNDFYVFKHNENDSTSVCGNIISCLETDGDSLLWIGTASSGFCSYDFRTGKFTQYTSSNSALITNNVNDIAFDKTRNSLWIALNNYGLQLFNLKTKSFDAKQRMVSSNTYYDVEVNDTVPYFAGIIESLKRLGKVGKFRTVVNDTAITINKIYYASNGNLWCGSWDNGLHEFSADAKRLATYFFDGSNKLKQSGDEIISLTEDENHILWCGTKSSGIHFFDLKARAFTDEIGLSNPVASRINSLYRDNMNRIWIASETGLFVYDPLQNQFEITRLPIPGGFNSCKVNDRVITPGGREYVITHCGLFYRYANGEAYRHMDFYYRNERQELTGIFMDEENTIYIGTNRSVFMLDTLRLKLFLPEVSAAAGRNKYFFFGGSRANSITKIKHHNQKLIAASLYGHCIMLYDIARKNAFCIFNDTTVKGGPIDNLSRKILFDSKNNLWICGASQGINKVLIPEKISFSDYPVADTLVHIIYGRAESWSSPNTTQVRSVKSIFDMSENADGSFWVTTQGHGLLKFFPRGDVTFLSFANQIKSLQGLARDEDENLWMVSSTGLLHYDVKTGRYKLFNRHSGIPENISGYFFQNSRSSQKKELTVGFDGGFISFYPAEIVVNQEKPVVSITRLWIMDSPADSMLHGELMLSYDQNFLKFNVAANSYSDNGQTTYQYLLEGIDQEWRNNLTNPLITYTNLPAGEFTLKVKAVNSDGMESEVYELPVHITPPFYNTLYFYGAVVLVVAAAVYALYRYRIRQFLKLQEVRNKIARDLHDDIGSTIGSINLYSQVAGLKVKRDKPEELLNILEKIESSSREIIDKTGDAVWAVNPENDLLKNLVLRMEGYAASLLGEAGIQFQIDYDEKLSGMVLSMNRRKNIFLIYKEAIHNILKYATATEVNISIRKNGGRLQIIIADNGKGFSTNGKAYNGNGIKNMKARAMEMNGTLQVVSEENKGTAIDISI